jgi:hypothetical protein
MLQWCVVSYIQRVQVLNNYGLNLPKVKILRRVEKYGRTHPLSQYFKSLIYQSYVFGGISVCNTIDKILLPQVPANVKANFAGELKILKRTVDDIKKSLSIQRDRLEQMYLLPRSWDLATWRDYLR